MASIIRIKRSSTSGNPATLGAGELAYSALTDNGSNGGDRLYIGIGAETSGNAANHFVVGGKYFTDMMDHTRGTLTASSALIVDADSKLDNLKVDNLDLNGNTISSTNTDGNIVLDPNGTGYVSITGTNGLIIPVGTTLQRGPTVQGTIRYNTDVSSFEGYNGTQWGSLGGVKSVDGLTYITAESSPGASDDTLSFVTNGTERLFIDTDSAEFDSTVVVKIDSTQAASSTSTGALVVAGGAGIAGALYVGGAISADSASFASINNTPIGNSTASTGAFTTLTANNAVTFTANTGSTSTTTGTVVVTGGVGISQNVFIGGTLGVTGETTLASATVSDLTSGRVTYAGTSGALQDSSNLTFNGTTLTANAAAVTNNATVGGTLGVTGETTLASATISDLTANRVVLAGTSGAIQDSANLTFDGTTLAVTGAVTISSTLGVTGNTTLTGDLTVNGNTTIGNANTDTVTVNADVASSLIPSSDAAYDLGAVGSEWRDLFVTGTANIDSLVADTADINGGSIDGVTIGTNSVVTDLRVDNIKIDGNEISSTDTNGNISLNPNGTGTVAVNSSRITGLSDPVDPQDAATKAYVDAARSGLDVKQSVRAATTANITLSNTQTIDGIALQVGDRVLVKDQSTGSENGVYVVASGSWARATDFDEPYEVTAGVFFFVEEGTVNADAGFVITSDNPQTVGTDPLTFTQFSGAGQIIAGDGLSKSGNTLTVNVANGIEISGDNVQLASSVAGDGLTYTSGVLDVVGTADRITANSNSIDIASTYVGQSSITTLGTIATGTWQGTAIADTYVANDLTISGGTINDTPIGGSTRSSGAFTTLAANNSVTFTLTTDASSTSAAAVVLSGGLAVAKKIYVGDDIIGAGAATSLLDGFEIDGGTY